MPRIPDSVNTFISRVRAGEIRHFQDIYGDELLDSINAERERNAIEDIIDRTVSEAEGAPAGDLADELERRFSAYFPDSEPDLVSEIKSVVKISKDPLPWTTLLERVNSDVPSQLLGSIKEKYESALAEMEYEKYSKMARNAALLRCFGEQVKILFPRRDGRFAKPLGEAEDPVWACAVAALVLGDFTRFDPVIGDEACEARPPFILDAWNLLMKFSEEYKGGLRALAVGYVSRHRKAYGDYDLTLPKEGESSWSLAFIKAAEKFKDFLQDSYSAGPDYLGLCYANTASSYLATDEWGMVSFDRERNPYGLKGGGLKDKRTGLQSALSADSVAYVRFMAANLAKAHNTQVLNNTVIVLDNVNIQRTDKGKPIYCLPIYEIMRTVMAHELLAKRPIILSLNQIKCFPQDGSVPQSALYELTLHTLFYRPVDGRYVLAEPPAKGSEDYDRPCMAIQAYQMVVEDSEMACSDGLAGFGVIGEEYLKALASCDLSLLIQAYAAVHPPFHHKAKDSDGEIKDPRAYMASIHQKMTSGEILPRAIARNAKEFSLLTSDMDLATEYATMLHLGEANDMAGKQYITRLLGEQWEHLKSETICMRAIDNCSFSVHHMNVNSWNKVVERDEKARQVDTMPRFHDFQSGQSKEDLE